MAFDGTVIANITHDMNQYLCGGRIYKIYQPEQDELLFVIKNQKNTFRLLLSASASLPLLYFTQENKANPLSAPNFCMLLRKHISNGRIMKITQPGLERIVEIEVEHLNELGDPCRKTIVIELMGKHSNIIFLNEDRMIIDSIKHISGMISSVREVLPGRDYVAPPTQGKISIHDIHAEWMNEIFLTSPTSVQKAIYGKLSGISPLLANELCFRCGIDGSSSVSSLDEDQQRMLYGEMLRLSAELKDASFRPAIIYDGQIPLDFSVIPLTMYQDKESVTFDSVSQLLETYYKEKEIVTRIRQKSTDLRKIITNAIERTAKKLDLQLKQLKDTEKKDKYKIYGELLHTYGYGVKANQKQLTCINYYNNEEITIPLDPQLSPMDNAKKYFDKYAKLKRTATALDSLTEQSSMELSHLESIANSLDIARDENDLIMIREELMEHGYMKKHFTGKKKYNGKSKPFHYISSDGFHMYVGKNNFQNDSLSFQFANGKDMWFHAKKMAGSHVIVKLETASELPDRTYEEAARLAAYYSKGKNAPKVEVDYTERRNLKKPPHAKPGYVIYHTNYSMNIEPDITGIQEL